MCPVYNRAVRPTPAFATDGYGICNARTHLGACRTHELGQIEHPFRKHLTHLAEALSITLELQLNFECFQHVNIAIE